MNENNAIVGIGEEMAQNETETGDQFAYKLIDRKKAGDGTQTQELVMHDVMYLTKTLQNLHAERCTRWKTCKA
jgi:hypothetical protein